MKKRITITEEDRNIILGLHQSLTKRQYLKEQVQYYRDAKGNVQILYGPKNIPAGGKAITQQEYEDALNVNRLKNPTYQYGGIEYTSPPQTTTNTPNQTETSTSTNTQTQTNTNTQKLPNTQNNLVKKLQGKILQTEFGSILGQYKDDGIWGKLTSLALSKLIEKYKSGQSTELNQMVQSNQQQNTQVDSTTTTTNTQAPVEKTGIGSQKDMLDGETPV